MTMERIVRPFESDSPFTARKLPPFAEPREVENVVVSWGKEMPVDYVQHVWSGIIGGKVVWRETARVTETVRVYQNNDVESPNFVDVERIKRIAMQDNNGQELEFNLEG